MVNTKVLVTGAGGGVGISIIKAAKRAGYKVIPADMNPLSAGLILAESKPYLVPSATSPDYLHSLIDICHKEKVDVIIPGSDPELPVIAKGKNLLEEESGTKVVVGSVNAVNVGRSKLLTQNYLRDKGFNYAYSVKKEGLQDIVGKVGFPLIVKPDYGSGSNYMFCAENLEELEFYVSLVDRKGFTPIIQEYLGMKDGEYTTGVMFGAEKEFLGSITLRRQIKKGSSYKAWSDCFPDIRDEMEKIGKALDTFGPLNLQCRMTDRGPVIFEINPRFSGTTAVRAWLGFNDVKMVVENYLHGTIPTDTRYQRNWVMIRYLEEVYIKYETVRDLKEKTRRG